jgi:hypothetical protein
MSKKRINKRGFRDGKKVVPRTIYFTKEIEDLLDTIWLTDKRADKHRSRSAIVADAIVKYHKDNYARKK